MAAPAPCPPAVRVSGERAMRPVSTARAVAILGPSAERPAIHDMAHPLSARSVAVRRVTLATPGRRRASGAGALAKTLWCSATVRSGDARPRLPDAPRKGATLAYLPALDGIRGPLHARHHGRARRGVPDHGWLLSSTPLALSGFLITSLLIVEWRKRDTIRLGAFWACRARRLLPALLVMLIGVSIIYGIFVRPAPTRRCAVTRSTLFTSPNRHMTSCRARTTST